MRILIVGLGLIGGAYAKKLSELGYEIYGVNHRQESIDFALKNKYIKAGSKDAKDFLNISGQIYGDENSNQWCKILHNKTKKQFYNPIFQNNGHIRALKHILGNSYPYYSIIVFSE